MATLLTVYAVLLCSLAGVSLVIGDSSTTYDLLWPQPESISFDTTVYSLNSASFVMKGTGAGSESLILKNAIDRYYPIIFETPVPFYPSGNTVSPGGILTTLTIQVNSNDESLNLTTDDSYSLIVGSTATITAATVFGAIRGLETFSQLVYHLPDDGLAINGVKSITDKPRFAFRGSMIDTSRHFLSVKTILSHLDAMSYNKFNVLNWHITDDQSFPYDSINFPNLTINGAYDRNHIYLQSDIQQVIRYAYERGIRVIPEFDTPGHSQSWGKGQPGLLTPCYSNNKPDGSYGPIDPIQKTTWDFLNVFYKEISEVFSDNYIHLGGDEVSFNCWQSNPDIQAWMKQNNYTNYNKVEEYYENTLINLVNNLGKSYVVWQEIFDNGLKIKMDTVIDVWKGGWQKEMDAVTKAGYNVILSSCWYLNYISYGEDWENYYKCDPQDFNGTDEQNAHVIGGHNCLWGEFVDSANFISRMWPRACAVAERLWSPKTVTDINNASVRIRNQRCRLISRGISAEPVVGPGYCATEWYGP